MAVAAQRGSKIVEPRASWLIRSLTVPPGDDRWMLFSAMVLCVCVFGWIAWQKLWSFWLDEAMLLISIERVQTFAGLFHALPVYDQGLPTGLALVAWALHTAALPIFTQKLLPTLAGAAILPALVVTARRSGFGATATMFCIFMLVASPEYSYLFCNFKQYAFEELAVTLMLLAAVSERRA
jgi:hypothetical protein